MKLRCIYFIVFLTSIFFSCKGQNSDLIKTISPKQFSEKITTTKNAQIIDVRTPQEYALGKIDNAKNIDWLDGTFVANVENLDKTRPVFVYCKSGGRSANAAAKLEALGFKTIYNLQGGLLKWDAEGFSKPADEIVGICSQEYAELLNTNKKVLIDFYAEWCAPCKKMTPYLLQLQKDAADKVAIVRLNADENPTLIKEMKILELPTLLLYENKTLTWKNTGYITEAELKKQLQ